MIHCTNCGHVNAEGATQCEACYDELPALTSCPTCQTSVPDDAFFCPQCGASLPRGVSHQEPSPAGAESPSLTAPPAFNELPPTNVVAHEALGKSPIPPTDVVSFPESANLPPTNVVNLPPQSDLPPTNVVNPVSPPSDLPPTNVVHPVSPPSDLPPTNVVNLPPQPDLPPTNVVHSADLGEPLPPANVVASTPSVADTIPPQNPPSLDEPEEVNDIESVPTLVVSPGSNRNVIEPPPIQDLPPQPDIQSVVPPTMPPQSPPSYQAPLPIESPDLIEPPPAPLSEPEPPSEPEPLEPASPVKELPEVEAAPSFNTMSPTTVQPFAAAGPAVGETLIQLPSAQLIHERTETSVTLPNQAVILVGKTTDSIEPDVDVSSFLDSDVVSRRHAAIFMEANGYFIEDLGSSNGTYVNDEPCERGERVQIRPGDRICLGRENKVGFIFQV